MVHRRVVQRRASELATRRPASRQRLAGRAAVGRTPDERRFLPNRPSRWAVAWAPDGSRFVFTAIRGDTQQLYLRSLADGLDAEPIPGTENSDTPFFSPDGQWLGFWRGNELRKMPASGGPSVRICATPPIFARAGARTTSWSSAPSKPGVDARLGRRRHAPGADDRERQR